MIALHSSWFLNPQTQLERLMCYYLETVLSFKLCFYCLNSCRMQFFVNTTQLSVYYSLNMNFSYSINRVK